MGNQFPSSIFSRGFRRKYDIERMRNEVPLKLYLFDVLYYEEPLLDAPFEKEKRSS